ncbi:tetratricopeptide repeat protein [Clostridium guangxiense]|uniref:tetratricopeptide repeat protein n=1 Tax=Clostridium guangxiense TaxID=1662055 RepID=UPI001E4C2823|nr:tetratricopeptide repeat protein [Clostridium guangxiense]MCD2348698.1 tetratricopeptide repeat protein [Clostridium guangxiense]
MRRNHITNYLILLILLAFSLSISGCSHKDKEIVVTKDVKMAAKSKQAENQVKKNIDLGNKLVDSGKYDEAKKAYDKAIELDKKDKQTYLTIKDKYLSKGKLQEAYDVVQEAITNNVDVENMKTLLSQIKAKLEANKLTIQDASTEKNKNNNSNQKPSENQSVSNSQQATAVVNRKIIGFVKSLYESNGKRYLVIDEVEFYRGDRAVQEAKKDGVYQEGVSMEWYSRKVGNGTTQYEISDNAQFDVSKYRLDKNFVGNSSINESVSYDKLKSILDSEEGKLLYWVFLQNNVVVNMDQQFIP